MELYPEIGSREGFQTSLGHGRLNEFPFSHNLSEVAFYPEQIRLTSYSFSPAHYGIHKLTTCAYI